MRLCAKSLSIGREGDNFPGLFVCENLPLGGRFQKAYSYKYVSKTPFDLLRKSCGLATASKQIKRRSPWVTLEHFNFDFLYKKSILPS